jgi:murein DD-endopeptidase MepM/ murein hydrolase activator NlpD
MTAQVIALALFTGSAIATHVASAATTGRAMARSPEKARPLFEVCPVDRPRHYVDDFGDARYFPSFHYHQGIDIMAAKGTPIRATFDGWAERWDSLGGGLAVYVHGRHGFVYNAHLSALGRMGKVHAGDIIGYVGNSGDAIGHSPHDHFEWHPRGGQAVDPFKLLNAACSRQHHESIGGTGANRIT